VFRIEHSSLISCFICHLGLIGLANLILCTNIILKLLLEDKNFGKKACIIISKKIEI